ncbi:hypothetical protein J1N10_19345 [Carboxylicivirga sp. A043]|uniref:hypothetical protein n=1 Tax=Carboxylicivirga litoralis TaxID=2816963 RepID=UPI0021CB3464|nr:hypothetical protein [Carboxylicivirga sp. A043]MCU4158138.1 hypothetical protein [Carboxylicivirga sp. A043]
MEFAKQVIFSKSKEEIIQKTNEKEVLLLDIGRSEYDSDMKERSLHFDNIKSIIGNDRVLHINAGNNSFEYDYNLQFITTTFSRQRLDKSQLILVKRLKHIYKETKRLKIYSKADLKNIKYSLQIFFLDYKCWDNFFSSGNFKSLIIINNFGKEGLIAAAKKYNIKVIELQHGLIIKESVPYVFNLPETEKKHGYLFPDIFLAYGSYWKKFLLKGSEYSEHQIKVLGKSTFNNNKGPKLNKDIKIENKNTIVILVTTQYNLHNSFIKYIKSIKRKVIENNLMLIIKPHPLEHSALYKSLEIKDKILITTKPIAQLFEITNILISSYSTTLFEAFDNNIPCYCIKADNFENYAESIIETGIAKHISLGEIPKLNNVGESKISKNEIYDSFNKELLLSEVN